MKKQVALAVAAALSLSVAGTALANPSNPFVDVPANHWAYDALMQLQKSGVVGGYGDGTFRGDRTLTRYEMASIVAKVAVGLEGQDAALIKRLQSEFATELYNLGVRVDRLERNASTIRLTGDTRIRYMTANTTDAQERGAGFQHRTRINMNANVNDNIRFIGRIKYEHFNNTRGSAVGEATDPVTRTEPFYFDRAEFVWKLGNTTNVHLGRMGGDMGGSNPIGQGLIWGGERADGIMGAYRSGKLSAKLGVMDVSPTAYSTLTRNVNTTVNVVPPPGTVTVAIPTSNWDTRILTVGHLGYKVTDNIGLTAGYSKAHGADNYLQQWAVGGDVKFGDIRLAAEYVQNNDADKIGPAYEKKGAWARVQYSQASFNTPGSYQVYGEYIRLGRDAILPYGLNRFDLRYDNFKGYGFGATYVVGKNHNIQGAWQKGDSFNGNTKYKSRYFVGTNFAF